MIAKQKLKKISGISDFRILQIVNKIMRLLGCLVRQLINKRKRAPFAGPFQYFTNAPSSTYFGIGEKAVSSQCGFGCEVAAYELA